MSKLTHIDLFSGIGGFALAARWAGIETVQFVEIDKFCQKVLQKNFPGVPIHDDIKSFTHANWYGLQEPRTEQQTGGNRQLFQNKPFLITGGFPCQPFSCAGKRRGKEDDRYLWEEMLRVIKEFKPTWIIGENVNGIRSMEFQDGLSELEGDSSFQADGNGDYTNVLDGICDSLEAIGYEVQPIIIPACAVNAPHRRDRVWIIANSKRDRCDWQTVSIQPRESQQKSYLSSWADCHASNAKSEQTQPTESRGFYSESSSKDSDVADTSNQGLQGGEKAGNIGIDWKEPRNEQFGRCPSWQEPWVEAATRLCRVDDGLPRQVDRVNRLKALGNAIVPQVACEIMKRIIEVSK